MNKRSLCVSLFAFLSIIFVISEASAEKYLYDSKNQLIELTTTYGTVKYSYDLNGNRIKTKLNNNLISNSSFEIDQNIEGVANGWSVYIDQGIIGKYDLTTAVVSEGKQAQMISASSIPKSGNAMNIWQEFLVSGGNPYNLKGKVKLEGMSRSKFSVILFYYDSNGQMIGGITPNEFTQNTADWVTFNANFAPPSNAATVRIHLHLHASADKASGKVYLDGFLIK